MRFNHQDLERAIDALPVDHPYRENFRLECRVDDEGARFYESAVAKSFAPDDLEMAHSNYISNHVNVLQSRTEPRPFRQINSMARVGVPNDAELLVRIEDLSWRMGAFIGGAQDLVNSFKSGEDQFKILFEEFDRARDRRPMFAAVVGDLDVLHPGWRKDWVRILPQVLGLGHLNSTPTKPRPLALMCYAAKRVIDAAGTRTPPSNRFAAPTMIDLSLNHYFMPSPFPNTSARISYGRAVNLNGSGTLACEMIHRFIPYELTDIQDMAVLTESVVLVPVGDCRKAHIRSLRAELGCREFGLGVVA